MLSTRFLRCLAFSLGVLVLTGVVPAFGQEPYVYIATPEDWDNALTSGAIEPMSETEWDEYMAGWQTRGHGEPYPPNVFRPCDGTTGGLYVWSGEPTRQEEYPERPGMVMYWLPPEGMLNCCH